MTTALKLFYFDIPGKGESIRLLCAHAGLPLEDVRISMSNRQVFDDLKNDGKLPFGQLPALQVNEKDPLITQSAAIMRYLGKVSNLYPICPMKAALVDAIIDEETDLTTGLSVSRYRDRFGFGCLDDAAVATIRASLNNDVIPRHLQFLENIAGSSKSGWIADTEEPSIADFILVPRLQWIESGAHDGIATTILDPYPHLKGIIAKLMALPAVVAYHSSQKK